MPFVPGLGSVSTNEVMLLAFFLLATLAFLYYMFRVVGERLAWWGETPARLHLLPSCAVEYQNMDPSEFEEQAEAEQVVYQDFTQAGKFHLLLCCPAMCPHFRTNQPTQS